jgi:hypothetical protein
MTQAVTQGSTSTYACDYVGNRVSQTIGNTTTIYPNKFYSITSTTNGETTYATTTVYVWNGDTLIATIDQFMVNGGEQWLGNQALHSCGLSRLDECRER